MDNPLNNPCSICGEREADIECAICSKCKEKVDGVEFEIERKHYEKEMLSINHKGTWCWADEDTFCQEGECAKCNIYIRWENEWRNSS